VFLFQLVCTCRGRSIANTFIYLPFINFNMRRQEFPQFVSGLTTKVNIFTDPEFLVDAR
jgi:hypothetical protein